jgi:hypothetical protein
VILVAVLGEPIRARLMARFNKGGNDQSQSPIRRIWDRFGLIGLSLLAPMTVGSQVGAALGITLGVPPRKVVIGMALGAAVWAAAITLAALLGLTAVQGAR